ncbi:MAG: DNA-binding protein [Oceanobacter sp.]
MARIGVTLDDVSQAATTLREQGQSPTVDRVREYLGRGSKSTITPLLRQWRQQQHEPVDLGELPEEIGRAVIALHKQLQAVAQQRMDSNEEKLNQEKTHWLETINQLKEQTTEQQSTIEELTQQLELSQNQEKHLNESLQTHRVQLATTEAQRDAVQQENSTLQKLHNQQQQELTALREQFEHYQEYTAEERQKEKEEFLHTRRQLEDSLHNKQISLEQASNLNTHLQQELSNYRVRQDALHQQQLEQAANAERFKAQNQTLTEQLNASDASRKTLTDQNNSLQEQLGTIATELASIKTAHDLQSEQAKQLNEQLIQERRESQQLTVNHAKLEVQLAALQADTDKS